MSNRLNLNPYVGKVDGTSSLSAEEWNKALGTTLNVVNAIDDDLSLVEVKITEESARAKEAELLLNNAKLNKLTPGTGILISSDNIISATGGGEGGGLTPEQEALLKQIENKANKATTLSGYGIEDAYSKTEINTRFNAKQNTLISGTNLKTINNQSLLGSGNISIYGGDSLKEGTIFTLATLNLSKSAYSYLVTYLEAGNLSLDSSNTSEASLNTLEESTSSGSIKTSLSIHLKVGLKVSFPITETGPEADFHKLHRLGILNGSYVAGTKVTWIKNWESGYIQTDHTIDLEGDYIFQCYKKTSASETVYYAKTWDSSDNVIIKVDDKPVSPKYVKKNNSTSVPRFYQIDLNTNKLKITSDSYFSVFKESEVIKEAETVLSPTKTSVKEFSTSTAGTYYITTSLAYLEQPYIIKGITVPNT